MIARQTTPLPPLRLCLDHGADETEAAYLQVEDRGVTFESPWEFQPMAELVLCLTWRHPRLGAQRFPMTGVVVASQNLGTRRYETTVLFLDSEDDQMEQVREFARQAG
jgi:hypothetical protein